MRRMSGAGIAFIIFLGAILPLKAQTFERGLDAYNAGNFKAAFRNWRALSIKGDSKSEAGLGFLYFRGLGVKQDDHTATLWFTRAAEKGEPTAQFLLGLFFLQGRGVTQSYVRAHMWCDLAMSRGYPDALACRDESALHMSARDFRRSDALVSKWQQARRAK